MGSTPYEGESKIDILEKNKENVSIIASINAMSTKSEGIIQYTN